MIRMGTHRWLRPLLISAMMLACQPLGASPGIDALLESLEERGIAIAYGDITAAGPDHRLTDVTMTVRTRVRLGVGFLGILIDDDWSLETSLDAITLGALDLATVRIVLPSAGTARMTATFLQESMTLNSEYALQGQDITLTLTDEGLDLVWAMDRMTVTSVRTRDGIQTTSMNTLTDIAGTFSMSGPPGATESLLYTAGAGSTRQSFDPPVGADSSDGPRSASQMTILESGYEVRVGIWPQRQALGGVLPGLPVISGSFVAEPSAVLFSPDPTIPDVGHTVLMQNRSADILLDDSRVLVSTDLAGFEFLDLQPGREFPILQSDGHTLLFSLATNDPATDRAVATLRLETENLAVHEDVLPRIDPGGLLAEPVIAHDIDIGLTAGIPPRGPVGDWSPLEDIQAEFRTFSLDLLGTTVQAAGSLDIVATASEAPDLIGRIDLETRNLGNLVAFLSQIPGSPPLPVFLAIQTLNRYLPDWDAEQDQPRRYTLVFERGDRMTVNGVER